MKRYRLLLGVAAALLVATAGLHATGLASIGEALAGSGISAGLALVFRGLWVMFSIHLVIVAALLAVLAARPRGRAVLLVAAAMPVADAVLLVTVAGVFAGSIMTGLAAVLSLLALIVQPVAGRG